MPEDMDFFERDVFEVQVARYYHERRKHGDYCSIEEAEDFGRRWVQTIRSDGFGPEGIEARKKLLKEMTAEVVV